ncbi:MAG: SGNH/GDSL hydrolase family protein [Butyrivibrio sp.]|uniref:SGNH/GDSL hydrolase family protein n=1 Tax=Butyrivibrio sp. TaxID=28121 RepID=UPI0025FA72EA|nr:SGNH/GDSL hydrolase family protein [Butyrivibrio sp.]MCR5773225.1 SGNH/GDSL hydrolase family protein [Butyrivibrio sp.]
MYNIGTLLTPIWDTKIVYRETFAMLKEGAYCKAHFLYKPDRILKIESYDGSSVYELGRDCYLEGNEIYTTSDSVINSIDSSFISFGTKEEADAAMERQDNKFECSPVMMNDGRYLNLGAIGKPSFITGHQIAITYRTTDTWKGYVPSNQIDDLPYFKKKIENKEKVNIVLYGDSICCGYDSSAANNESPYQPIWPKVMIDGLRESYAYEQKEDVNLINVSESGMNSDWAYDNVRERVFEHDPDLVILGFGMNDRDKGSEYARKTLKIIDRIREKFPECDFVLISTSLPNPEVHTPPYYFDCYHAEYSDALRSITSRGIVLADVQSVHKELLKHKRFIDITGNMLNHPGDFVSAIYAQVLYETLRI